MKVNQTNNENTVLNVVRVGDIIVAVNMTSLVGFPTTFSAEDWVDCFKQFKDVRLITFFRCGDGEHTFLPQTVLIGNMNNK